MKPITRAVLRELEYRMLSESFMSAYESFIRKLANDLWNGRIGTGAFEVLMVSHIQGGLKRAWYAGAKEIGIKPDELSRKELDAMNAMIMKETSFVPRFTIWIALNSRARKGRWRNISNRVKLWGRRYLDAKNKAKVMAEGDPKLEWVVGGTKNTCTSCGRLNGKVKRASYWEERGVFPQSPPNPQLVCKGYFCNCTLEKTEKPLSRGPLPKLP